MKPTLSPAARNAILEDEFVRSVPPGLRPFSVGILKLSRKLELAFATGKAASAEQIEGETLALAWLLDLRHSIREIEDAAEQGPAFLTGSTLTEYRYATSPAFLMLVKAELDHTERAVLACDFRVEQKPDAKPEDTPSGN